MIYDIAILGGGPAGYSAAFEAVKYGSSVILFEKKELGGTCLNRGCIPTKFLVHTVELYSQMKKTNRYGISAGNVSINITDTAEQMKKTVQQLRERLQILLEQKKIEVANGDANLIDPNTIECCGYRYKAKNIIVATGSKPAQPFICGASNSDDALKLDYIPGRVKILGGGVVAVEFANIFNKLGSEVTIAIRGDRILRKWDRELAVSVAQNLKQNGVKIITGCTVGDFCEGEYDFLLSAIGRVPRTSCLQSIKVKLDEKGAVLTDENGRTSIPDIYAAGDVISGSHMLAHTAMEQGRRAVRHIAGEENGKPSAVAGCIYINPEAVSVGLTEAQAKSDGIEVIVGKQNMISNAMTLISTDKRSFIKVIVEKKSSKILGAQLMCGHASDIASEFVVAVNNGLTVKELRSSVHPHPSFSEAVMEVMDVLEEKINGKVFI